MTDYTRNNAGVSIVFTGGPNGTRAYLTWIAATGTPHIYIGAFNFNSSMTSVITSDYSPESPIWDRGNVDFTNNTPGPWLSWRGSTNQDIYSGTYDGSSNLQSFPQGVTSSNPSATYTAILADTSRDCHDAYADSSGHLQIDSGIAPANCA
ncbi:MAG TPA: hypothetical protein VF070_40005 [Streptosporangiaceae bacterium]